MFAAGGMKSCLQICGLRSPGCFLRAGTQKLQTQHLELSQDKTELQIHLTNMGRLQRTAQLIPGRTQLQKEEKGQLFPQHPLYIFKNWLCCSDAQPSTELPKCAWIIVKVHPSGSDL